MKQTWKWAMMLFVALTMAIGTTACSSDDDDDDSGVSGDVEKLLVGRWYEEDDEYGSYDEEWYMVFNADGRGYEYEDGKDWFTWKYEKSSKILVCIYDDDPEDYWAVEVVSITSTTLKVKESGEIYTYYKK